MTRKGGKSIPSTYWALWRTDEDQTAWYNMPCAQIRKVKDRCWELSLDASEDVRQYKTLKEAKAMGIVLTRMEK